MKYILLDFDGVLTSFGVDWFAPTCIDALKHIVEETAARIVVSSSWRELGEYR